jgi:hypothetical protein
MRFCTLLGLLSDYAFFAEGAKQTAKDAIMMLAPRLASIQFAPDWPTLSVSHQPW